MLGTTELLLLGGLALLIFGGKKVPEMMRGLGQGVKEFKKGMSEGDNIENKVENIETPNGEPDNKSQSSHSKGQDNEQK